MKELQVICLMAGGLAPTGKSQDLLVEKLFPERRKAITTLCGGPAYMDPAYTASKIGRNTAVAVIYKEGDEFFADRVEGRKLRKLRKMLFAAKENESSWDVAMRLHR